MDLSAYTEEIKLGISGFALFLSIWAITESRRSRKVSKESLNLSLDNQRERRHGEIVQLRYSLLSTLANHYKRISFLLSQLESYKSLYQALPDTDFKRESLELISEQLALGARVLDDLKAEKKKLQDMITLEVNSTPTLLFLQSRESQVKQTDDTLQELEDCVLRLHTLLEGERRKPW